MKRMVRQQSPLKFHTYIVINPITAAHRTIFLHITPSSRTEAAPELPFAPEPAEAVGVGLPKPPESAGPSPVTEASGTVLVPITNPVVPSEIGVPETKTAELPCKTCVPSIAKPLP